MNASPLPAPDAAGSDRPEQRKMEALLAMAGGVAHDYSNPLTSILGNNDIVLRGLPEGSPLREHALRIESSARFAIELTQEILTCTGRIRLRKEPVDLSRLVRDVLAEVEPAVGRNVRLESRPADGLPAINAEADKLRQALRHLVSNAADALLDRTGTVTVSTELAQGDREPRDGWFGDPPRPGINVALTVSDDGCGMSSKVQERIFDPFFSTKIRARGMGLPVALGIVRAHRGAIRVRSAPDQGSDFRILLPCAA